MSKIKFTKLTVEMKSGETIEFTMEEAKELYDNLDELFGKKVQYVKAPARAEYDRWNFPHLAVDDPLKDPYRVLCHTGKIEDKAIKFDTVALRGISYSADPVNA